ncbi:MAG: hypothetical protein AAF331_15640, partial [Pseudomonadota bacterium]
MSTKMILLRHKFRQKFLISSVALAALFATLPIATAQETEDEDAVMNAVVVEGRRISQTDLAIGRDEATNT